MFEFVELDPPSEFSRVGLVRKHRRRAGTGVFVSLAGDAAQLIFMGKRAPNLRNYPDPKTDWKQAEAAARIHVPGLAAASRRAVPKYLSREFDNVVDELRRPSACKAIAEALIERR